MAREPLAVVSCDRIVRLRAVMPDESPIDLDEHAAVIAYAVEQRGAKEEGSRRRKAHIEVTREYVQDVHRFLDEIRQGLGTRRDSIWL